MMRLSMVPLLAFHGGSQELRLQSNGSLDHDLFPRIRRFEDRGPPACRFADTDGTNREAVGRSPHKDDVLAVDLLDGVGGNHQHRLLSADRNLGISQHFRFELHSWVVQHNPNLHNASRLVEFLTKISDFPWKAFAGFAR